MVEIDRHRNPVARPAGILRGLAIGRGGSARIRGEVDDARLIGANRDLQESRLAVGSARIMPDRRGARHCGVLDGRDACALSLGLIVAHTARESGAILQIILARHSIADSKAGGVLDGNPGVEQPGDLDDGEQQKKNGGHDQRKLDQSLPAEPPTSRPKCAHCRPPCCQWQIRTLRPNARIAFSLQWGELCATYSFLTAASGVGSGELEAAQIASRR